MIAENRTNSEELTTNNTRTLLATTADTQTLEAQNVVDAQAV